VCGITSSLSPTSSPVSAAGAISLIRTMSPASPLDSQLALFSSKDTLREQMLIWCKRSKSWILRHLSLTSTFREWRFLIAVSVVAKYVRPGWIPSLSNMRRPTLIAAISSNIISLLWSVYRRQLSFIGSQAHHPATMTPRP
jgi:hypothetical protein